MAEKYLTYLWFRHMSKLLQFLSSAYGVSPGPKSQNSVFLSFFHSFRIQFCGWIPVHCTVYSLWWEPWPRENCTVCAVHVYTLFTRTVPTTHLEIKLAWVSALQSWAYNNQGKYRIIGTSIDFLNLRLIMNRVGILARASTNNEIFQTKILAWVSTLQSSTQHKIN